MLRTLKGVWMNSLKDLILQWLGLYDLLLKIDRLEKEVKLYKAKLEYFADASAGVADILRQKLDKEFSGKVDDATKMLEYLGARFKRKEW